MKPFRSFLAEKFEDYITYRESLGYIDPRRTYFRKFDQFVIKKSYTLEDFKPELMLRFIHQLDLSPITKNRIISSLRGFFTYLEGLELVNENPLKDITYLPVSAYIPYIFSEKDIGRLLTAIQKKIRKDPKYFFWDYSIYIIILLMARCGLRISEPLKLIKDSYRTGEGTLYIHKTKFNKDRLIPVPLLTMQALENYLAVRSTMIDKKNNPHFFPGKGQYKISIESVYSVFHQAVGDIGIKQEKTIFDTIRFGKPTPHSFRHSFAVNMLKEIKKRGKSPQDALPYLAAYMGHTKYQHTAVYLRALDADHRQRLFSFTNDRLKDI